MRKNFKHHNAARIRYVCAVNRIKPCPCCNSGLEKIDKHIHIYAAQGICIAAMKCINEKCHQKPSVSFVYLKGEDILPEEFRYPEGWREYIAREVVKKWNNLSSQAEGITMEEIYSKIGIVRFLNGLTFSEYMQEGNL